jgi:hypothetical protein
MTLDVDATDAPMKILHATIDDAGSRRRDDALLSQVDSGEHMPSGPIANLTGLHVFADGAELRGGVISLR